MDELHIGTDFCLFVICSSLSLIYLKYVYHYFKKTSKKKQNFVPQIFAGFSKIKLKNKLIMIWYRVRWWNAKVHDKHLCDE